MCVVLSTGFLFETAFFFFFGKSRGKGAPNWHRKMLINGHFGQKSEPCKRSRRLKINMKNPIVFSFFILDKNSWKILAKKQELLTNTGYWYRMGMGKSSFAFPLGFNTQYAKIQFCGHFLTQFQVSTELVVDIHRTSCGYPQNQSF